MHYPTHDPTSLSITLVFELHPDDSPLSHLLLWLLQDSFGWTPQSRAYWKAKKRKNVVPTAEEIAPTVVSSLRPLPCSPPLLSSMSVLRAVGDGLWDWPVPPRCACALDMPLPLHLCPDVGGVWGSVSLWLAYFP